MNFDTFVDAAWNDHADHAEDVAQRLAGSLALIEHAAQVAPYARLVTHVFGEHLAHWQRGADLLSAIAALPASAGAAERAVLARSSATLRYAGGDPQALTALATEDRIVALAAAASAFAAHARFGDALAAYEAAVQQAASGLPAGSPAIRALAVGGNNLASALERKAARDTRETAGMLSAAEAGLEYWRQAGTWLEEERAQYRLARSRLAAGHAAAAADAAQACLDVCADHDAPPFERFFGHAVLAVAQHAAGRTDAAARARAAALEAYERVPEGDRPWCATELAELGA